jgi:hypothetical protein
VGRLTGYAEEEVVAILLDEAGGWAPYAAVGGGIDIRGGYGCCGAWDFSDALGGGGIFLELANGVGTGPD